MAFHTVEFSKQRHEGQDSTPMIHGKGQATVWGIGRVPN
jgi:hypothetical protein